MARFERSARIALTAVSFACGLLAVADVASAQSRRDVSVTIDHVKALDRVDWGVAGQADFYARVTIAGETFVTKPARGENDVRPNWVFTKSVRASARVPVKVEIFDKDVFKPDERVDINRVNAKRDLDFTVNTYNCSIGGFSNSFRCKQPIMRGGQERKRAEVTFRVDVSRR
jgi:hypothetical protein